MDLFVFIILEIYWDWVCRLIFLSYLASFWTQFLQLFVFSLSPLFLGLSPQICWELDVSHPQVQVLVFLFICLWVQSKQNLKFCSFFFDVLSFCSREWRVSVDVSACDPISWIFYFGYYCAFQLYNSHLWFVPLLRFLVIIFPSFFEYMCNCHFKVTCWVQHPNPLKGPFLISSLGQTLLFLYRYSNFFNNLDILIIRFFSATLKCCIFLEV